MIEIIKSIILVIVMVLAIKNIYSTRELIYSYNKLIKITNKRIDKLVAENLRLMDEINKLKNK